MKSPQNQVDWIIPAKREKFQFITELIYTLPAMKWLPVFSLCIGWVSTVLVCGERTLLVVSPTVLTANSASLGI